MYDIHTCTRQAHISGLPTPIPEPKSATLGRTAPLLIYVKFTEISFELMLKGASKLVPVSTGEGGGRRRRYDASRKTLRFVYEGCSKIT